MAFDPGLGKLVLFGGESGGFRDGDTWTWDGDGWTQLDPAQSPPARNNASLAYDPALGQLVLFGGSTNGNWLSDTWAFNGSTWTQIAGRLEGSNVGCGGLISYDAATSQLLLFSPSGTNATFVWSGSSWSQLSPTSSPPGGCGASIAYNSDTGHVDLFVGFGLGSSFDSQLWDWNGSTWELLESGSGPSPRGNAGLAYDSATEQLVLFGGDTVSTTWVDLGDTWTWNGNVWQSPSSPGSPPARGGMAFAYDPAANQVVLFGGHSFSLGGEELSDTWIWH
jgi:hypothetical protein